MASDWQRALIALSATVVGLAVVAVLYFARSIFIPVTLAIFLSFVLSPVVSRLQRRGLGRTTSVILTVGLLILGTAGAGALVAQQMVQLAETLPDRKETIKQKVTSAREWVVGGGNSRFGELIDDVSQIISPKPPEGTQTVVAAAPEPSLASQLNGYMSPAAEVLGQGALAFILTVFMLINREDMRNRMIRLLGAGKVTTTTKAVDDASQRISRYLLSQLLLNTAFGVVVTIGLFVIGLNYAILWGFIAFVMRYVPYVGTWIGVIPPVLFSVATAEGWGQPLAVFALFIGLELLCNNLFEPVLYGQSMGLSEVAQLVAAAFWAFLWGPIGLILSGPLTVCLLVLGRHVRQFEFFEVLLGDQPALEPRVAFYQRLAARDQDEAAELALELAREKGAEEALDTVLVPALCLARRDHHEGDLSRDDLRAVVASAREIAEEVAALKPETAHPSDTRVRVLVVPARDEAEHVAAEVLALTLDPTRWEVRVAGDETLASELVESAAEFRPAVVLLVTLPPGGSTHARYILTRLRKRFPDVRLLLGQWGTNEEEGRREPVPGIDGVDRSLAASRKRLSELFATLDAAADRAENRVPRPELVGTTGA